MNYTWYSTSCRWDARFFLSWKCYCRVSKWRDDFIMLNGFTNCNWIFWSTFIIRSAIVVREGWKKMKGRGCVGHLSTLRLSLSIPRLLCGWFFSLMGDNRNWGKNFKSEISPNESRSIRKKFIVNLTILNHLNQLIWGKVEIALYNIWK